MSSETLNRNSRKPAPLGHFADLQADFVSKSQDVSPLFGQLRHRAWDGFKVKGIPTLRHEDYKYTNLRPLLNWRLQVASEWKNTSERTVLAPWIRSLSQHFVFCANGRLLGWEGVSSGQLVVRQLADLSGKEESEIVDELESFRTEFSDPLVDLNMSFLHHGSVVDVNADFTEEAPLVIVHLVDEEQSQRVVSSVNVLNISEGRQVHCIEVFVGGGADVFVNHALQINIAPKASLIKRQVQALSKGIALYDAQRVTIAADGAYKSFVFDQGGMLTRHSHDLSLRGQNADAKLQAVYLARGQQLVDHHTVVRHLHADSNSHQVYKGIVHDGATSVFNGKIIVDRNAPRCSARQLNKNLMLGHGVEVNSKPELQIDTDDIQCSHGATVGRLNEDELFYLMSRGLTSAAAEHLLGMAYVSDLIEQEAIVPLKQYMRSTLESFFVSSEEYFR